MKGKTKVTVVGTDLTGATAVSFAGKPASSVTVASESQPGALSPPGKPGKVLAPGSKVHVKLG